jgi:hypothetical protein
MEIVMNYVNVPVLMSELVRQSTPSDICRDIDKAKAKEVISLCLSKLDDVDLELLTRQIDVELCKEVDQFSL